MELIAELVRQEPVRVYLYSVVFALMTLLISAGVVTASLVPAILGFVAAVLAVPAIELARSKVSPVAKQDQP